MRRQKYKGSLCLFAGPASRPFWVVRGVKNELLVLRGPVTWRRPRVSVAGKDGLCSRLEAVASVMFTFLSPFFGPYAAAHRTLQRTMQVALEEAWLKSPFDRLYPLSGAGVPWWSMTQHCAACS